MKTLILSTLLILIFSVPASTRQDRDQLKYNHMADKWEYAAPEDRIKYNPMEDTWSYEPTDSYLRYNPMEDKFEYAE